MCVRYYYIYIVSILSGHFPVDSFFEYFAILFRVQSMQIETRDLMFSDDKNDLLFDC